MFTRGAEHVAALASGKNQRLGDMAASTRVVEVS